MYVCSLLLSPHMFSDESNKLEMYIDITCKYKINKLKKYKSLPI